MGATLFAKHWTDGVQDVLGGQVKARRYLHFASITVTANAAALVLLLRLLFHYLLLLPDYSLQGLLSISRSGDRLHLQHADIAVPTNWAQSSEFDENEPEPITNHESMHTKWTVGD